MPDSRPTACAQPHDTMISEHASLWLRLAMVHGIGPMLGRKLIAATHGITPLWHATSSELRNIDGIRPQLITALANSKPEQSMKIVALCKANQLGILCPDDPLWPPLLAALDDAPLLLFYRGNPACLSHTPLLAMVGARRASPEGRLLCRRWSRYFAAHQVAIVSGMAFGIDGAAHGGALEAHGITIAVLGCGLLSLNAEQQRQVAAITRQGCVISEFLPEQPARPEYFPHRNRIIAGLAQATLVMEADIRSGSLITARLAADYGRDVMAVPGPVLNGNHAGCHQLIRDGATLLECTEDLLTQIGVHNTKTIKTEPAQCYHPSDAIEAEILSMMCTHAVHLDLLAETCGLTLPELSPILLRLELQGVIERLPGSRYLLAMELSDT
ncbi:MAG: DNA-processing protein DprA [Mariprofundus sp.]